MLIYFRVLAASSLQSSLVRTILNQKSELQHCEKVWIQTELRGRQSWLG